MKRRTLIIIRWLLFTGILIIIGLTIFKMWQAYTYFNIHPQQQYYYGMFEQKPPELTTKLAMYNTIKYMIGVGTLLVFLIQVLDYFIKPDNHYFNTLKEWAKKAEEYFAEDKLK